MGNKKNTVLVFVIAILFIASGVVLYNGFFKSSTSTINSGVSDKAEIVNLLPYGTKLDFEPVTQHADSGASIVYEKVDPRNVAVDIHSLISPVKDEAPTQVNTSTQRGQRIQ